ncbi:hypothetical protein [Holdemanella biformis]
MVKKLIFIEIKKCINPKIIFAFCFFTIIFLSTFFLYSISSTDVYVNEFSINAKIDGISAKRDAQAKIEKKLTDKELRNSLKVFTGITNDKSNFDSTGNLMINDSESIKMFNKYSDLANLVIRAYSPMYSFDPDILNHLDLNDITVQSIFVNRENNIKTINPDFSDKLKEQKYIDFGYSLGWQTLLNDLPYIQIYSMIISLIIAALIFFVEKKCNMNMILRTLITKESKINFIKAITVLIMNSAIYFSIVLIYSALIWSVFGLEGWNMKIQTSYLFWLSPLNINYFQAYMVNVLIGYLAVLVVTFFTSLLVKINEKKYIGELLSILFIFIPFMFNNYSFFCFFPSNVIQLSRNILNFSWINGINSIYLEFIALLCVTIFLFLLVCRKNRKET